MYICGIADFFEIRTGILEGCGGLGNRYRLSTLKRCTDQCLVNIKLEKIDDDVVLFAVYYDEMEIMLNNIPTTAGRIGLRIT